MEVKMLIHYEFGELTFIAVLVVLFIIISVGFSYFVPTITNITKRIVKRVRKNKIQGLYE